MRDDGANDGDDGPEPEYCDMRAHKEWPQSNWKDIAQQVFNGMCVNGCKRDAGLPLQNKGA